MADLDPNWQPERRPSVEVLARRIRAAVINADRLGASGPEIDAVIVGHLSEVADVEVQP